MALELVGGALLSSFLQVAFDRLASSEILHYFQSKRLDKKLLDKLNISLLSINAVIDDAEDKHIKDRHVSAWLDKVKDVVYDAEDLLDEIHYEVLKSKMEAEAQSSTASKVWSYFSPLVTSSFDMELQSRMKEILDSLEFLASKKDILGLKEGGGIGIGLGKKVSQRLSTTSLVMDEAAVCGRDDDKKIIIDMLLSDNGSGNNLAVVSIVGMGGMGKTTLAQLAFKDNKVEDGFIFKAWVCVSEEFDVVRITRTILKEMDLSNDDKTNLFNYDKMDLNMLQNMLKEKLSTKKFLLVLDDVWNEDYLNWEALQTPFVNKVRGSKILVTTRSKKVASTMRCAHLHELKQLSEDDSWLLFCKYAFRDANPAPSFEETGKQIIKRCKGLPLALKTIGSLLYTKSSYKEWNVILSSEMWDLSDDGCNIIPSLRLSYQYLPSALKRCFAYCSLLPKDYEFGQDYLVELWIGENLLQFHQQNKTMKELGDQFFNDLLLRSLFQQSSENEELFVMHDLVNDLAKYVSGKFCLCFEEDKETKNVSNMTRHFSYLKVEDSKQLEAIYKANKLRTFLQLQGYYSINMSSKMLHDLLSKFTRLRVLSLSNYENNFEIPYSIGNLKHLRYFKLSCYSIKRLPDSICFLYNLEILKLAYCENLEELPHDMQKLINLRYLDIRGTKVRKLPNGLGKLEKLEVLSSFYVGKCNESNINELAHLKLRATLTIEELQNVADPKDAFVANLKNKIHLETLKLGWSENDDGSQNERDVLENLRPPANLKELEIERYGGTKFPDWFGDNYLCNLVSLKLIDCQYCYSLPPLGILHSLKELYLEGLEGIKVIGSEFYGNSCSSSEVPFASLQILSFERMDGWEEWDCQNASGVVFHHLKELKVKNCPNLKNQLPEHLPCLMKLVIKNCMQLVAPLPSAPEVQKLRLVDCGNLQWESLPPMIKVKALDIGGQFAEKSFLEKAMYSISNPCLESLEFLFCHSLNSLRSLSLKRCDSLRTFSFHSFPKLQHLSLYDCSNFESFCFSESLIDQRSLTSLERLAIYECPKFVSLPEGIHTLFPSLTFMELSGCPQLECCEGGLQSGSLKILDITRCPKLVASQIKWGLHACTSLNEFYIGDENVESFPEQGLLPATLTYLYINFCSNLKMLDYRGLCHLTSLETLFIQNCPRLESFPKEGLPISLSQLFIHECPMLKQRCQKQTGEDWSKIAHIPSIIIDD